MTIKRLEILKQILIWGPPYDATIDINNFLPHQMIQQKDISNFFSKNLILSTKFEKSKIN
jgi:hypothetical protein